MFESRWVRHSDDRRRKRNALLNPLIFLRLMWTMVEFTIGYYRNSWHFDMSFITIGPLKMFGIFAGFSVQSSVLLLVLSY